MSDYSAALERVYAEQSSRHTLRDSGLIEACDDPDLFGFPLWPRQRELLAYIENGPRLQVLALGRRASKTTMMALVGLWCCLLRPSLRERLRPGETGYAVGVATKLDQGRLMIDAARAIVEGSPLLASQLVDSTMYELRFANNNVFRAFPCTSRGGRGWPVFALLMDEVAHFMDTAGNSAAESVWQAFWPATAQFGDLGRAVIGSTPWGTSGLFADLYTRAQTDELPGALAHHATSQEINPTLSDAFLEMERMIMGQDEFATEYLADFVSAGASFLDPGQIAEAIVERGELAPDMATNWIAGLDPAFSRDPFGIALVGRSRERKKLVLGFAGRWLPDRSAPDVESFEGQRRVQDSLLDQVAEVCKRFRADVLTDQHLAPAVVDRLKRSGLHVRTETMTANSKTAAFAELRARLAAQELELYGEPQLLDELRRLRSRFTAGTSQVVNPRVGDSHGDMAQALALATWGHRTWHPLQRPARVGQAAHRPLQIGGLIGQ